MRQNAARLATGIGVIRVVVVRKFCHEISKTLRALSVYGGKPPGQESPRVQNPLPPWLETDDRAVGVCRSNGDQGQIFRPYRRGSDRLPVGALESSDPSRVWSLVEVPVQSPTGTSESAKVFNSKESRIRATAATATAPDFGVFSVMVDRPLRRCGKPLSDPGLRLQDVEGFIPTAGQK